MRVTSAVAVVLFMLGAYAFCPVSADCKTTWNNGDLPTGCDFRTTQATDCPAACQTHFDKIKSDCKVDDLLASGIIDTKYKQYTIWGEFYQQYPKCNLGYTATACDVALHAIESEVMGKCKKASNSPCSADCKALITAVNEKCAKGPATYVPTSSELAKTYTQQTYRQQTIDYHFSSIVYDASCVALFAKPTSGTTGTTASGTTASTSHALRAASLSCVTFSILACALSALVSM